ncbi:hypothetical protein SLITO_v1c04620 [Spiroplasma litorale]|uniref:Uncharacterized protein n=1 Tax=Spiroplasma litorale TaxID=216942 RepID=A0A0K1W1B5_9MOLU|nr:hypothetical protein [Spiroplasma litorale]AKX34115.1 hypothetical protein SLITO_v1c04620 [Spiroplasma litorale]
MKKILFIFLLFPIIIISLCNFFISQNLNENNNTLEDKLNQIIRKNKDWPEENDKFLDVWVNLHEESLKQINNSIKNIVDHYTSVYIEKYYYYKQNHYVGDTDSYGVPNFELNKLLNDIYNSDEVQFQSAYILRALYAESKINVILGKTNNLINPTSEIVLWAFKYYNALVFFQWIKIWINELGRNIEYGLSIDFYSFGGYVQLDENDQPKWDLPPSDKKPEAKPKTSLNKQLKDFVDETYNFVFINKGNKNNFI